MHCDSLSIRIYLFLSSMMATYIVNEVLMYTFNRFDMDRIDDIIMTLDHFYGLEAIATAKQPLWEKYSDALPNVDDRVSRSHQSTKMKQLNDICSAGKTIEVFQEGASGQICC